MTTTRVGDDDLLAVRAAELYYDENKTQDEIGAILGITRWKAGRLIASARERGIVRIEIIHPLARRQSLERRLRERFGLSSAVVVPLSDLGEHPSGRVAQAAADHLTAMRPTPRTLGVSWGRTIDDVAARLVDGWAAGVSVVQVNGGVSVNDRASSAAATAVSIARKGGGDAVLLPVPAIFERVETRRIVAADRTVAGVLERADAASAYLYSAGVADDSSILVGSGYLTGADVAELVSRGAIGDVVGRYIDADGHIVDESLDDRTIGLRLDRLRAADIAIFVVAGAEKHRIARAVVENGLCTTIVTDEDTARFILRDEQEETR